jgi:hypothetical protein
LSKPRDLTDGQRAYEQRRAAKAGVSLDKWLDTKRREQEAAAKARAKAEAPPPPPKPPGLLSRLIDRAHKPLKTNGKG